MSIFCVSKVALALAGRACPRGDDVRRLRRGIGLPLIATTIVAGWGCADIGRDAGDAGDVPLYRAQEDLRIGSMEGGGPDGFGNISGLATDASDRLFIVDIQAHEIRVFDEDGGYLFTAGRAGSGPGELNAPCCPGVAPDGLLWVRDNGNGRYVAFEMNDDGAQGAMTRGMNHSDANRHVRTTFTANGRLIDIGSRPDPATGQMRTVLFHLGDGGEVSREVLAPLPPESEALMHAVQVMVGEVAVTRFFQQPFGPQHVVAYGPDGMHADAVTSGYEVRRYSPDGELSHTVADPDAVGPPLAPQQRSRADSLIAADEQIAGTSMPYGVPERHPVIAALYFDNEGHLWVERTALPGEPRLVDVYDSGGELVRRVEVPAELDLTYGVVRHDQLIGVVRDDLDVQYVLRLRIEEDDR